MKFFKIIKLSLGSIAICYLLLSCAKTKPELVSTTALDFSNKARVQIYDAAMGTARNYVYVDGGPSSGATFAFAATYPTTPANFALTAGLRDFLIKDTLPTSTQPQMAFGETLQAGAFYTIFMYDTVNAVKHKTVVNDIQVPTDTAARIRFANFVYSPFATPSFDLFSVSKNAVVISNISVTQVSDFISYPSNKTDTFYLRVNGTGTNLMNRTVSTAVPPVTTFTPVQLIFSPTNKRNYTIVFRGSYRTDLTTAGTPLRTLSVFSSN